MMETAVLPINIASWLLALAPILVLLILLPGGVTSFEPDDHGSWCYVDEVKVQPPRPGA